MSLKSVESFYQRLATDEDFRTLLQSVKTKEECSQVVKSAGYDFTQEEFETYTAQLIEPNNTEGELRDLEEKELEAVAGGITVMFNPALILLMYGVVQSLYRPQ